MVEANDPSTRLVRVGPLAELLAAGRMTARVGGLTLAVFVDGENVYAVDNRCPHMGFPLHRGTVRDGILTCHWHHARFDLASGGTFDLWADDVEAYPTIIRDGDVWIDATQQKDFRTRHQRRLRVGLERDIPLIIGKSVLSLLADDSDPTAVFRSGLDFGAHYRQGGWGRGLTIHTCMMNLLADLDPDDRPRALYHGLSAVADDCASMPPRFRVQPLPGATVGFDTLLRWFRQFVDVRDAEGAERCLVSAILGGAGAGQMADMLFTAGTDHRYLQSGHVLDFTNKAFEALDYAGWEYAELTLTSLVHELANAERMEESNAWRRPIDLVAILEPAFDELPNALEVGRLNHGRWNDRDQLVQVLLGDNPADIAAALLAALREGAARLDIAQCVAYAAALRIARFHTSNEFADWDTALHTFSFAHAVHNGLRRSTALEPLRGVFDAAMSVYLDRFLNIPAASMPEDRDGSAGPRESLQDLSDLFDRQQQVDQAGAFVSKYLTGGGPVGALLAVLGRLLLREDRDFHTIQMIDAAFGQFRQLSQTRAGAPVLIAAVRYLAAHAPTVRAQGQTFQIAQRLHRGECLHEAL